MLKQMLIDSSKYSLKCPYDMKPIGICIHNTYNDASAENEIKYMINNNSSTSYHIAVDDKEAIQAISFNKNAWAAGDGNGDGNRKYIHVEICYSKSGGERFNLAEARAAKEVAELCIKYGWDITNIKPHSYFSKKNCPHRTDIKCFLQAVQSNIDQYYKPAIDTVVIITNDVDERIAKYLNDAFGWGILMLNQYKVGTAKRVVTIGGAVGKLKADIELNGLDRYDTADIVIKYIKENRK